MKKVIFTIFAGMLTLASCMNDWDTEQISSSLYSNDTIGEPTVTIAELRKNFNSEISNSSYKLVTTDDVVEGVVVANDISGNIYQYIYI